MAKFDYAFFARVTPEEFYSSDAPEVEMTAPLDPEEDVDIGEAFALMMQESAHAIAQ